MSYADATDPYYDDDEEEVNGIYQPTEEDVKDDIKREAGVFTSGLYKAIKDYVNAKSRFSPEIKWILNNPDIDKLEPKKAATQIKIMRLPFDDNFASMYLLAAKYVFAENYDIIEKCSGPGSYSEPPNEVKVDIDYRLKENVYEDGLFYLVNKTNGNRLICYIINGMDSYFSLTCLKEADESENFAKLIQAYVRDHDIYKNKTLMLTALSGGGLIPQFIKKSTTTKDDVILDDDVWIEIQSNVIDVFRKNKLYKDLMIPTKRGLIFEGPPGKSMLVKYLAHEMNNEVTIIYVTEGVAHYIRQIFKMARKYAPTILVFEDVDGIGVSRSMTNNGITSELLSQLDGLDELSDFVTLATTNYPELIDEALKNRPARFDRRIKIDIPKPEMRSRLLKKFLTDKKYLHINDDEIHEIAELTPKFTGAHLEELIVTAQMESLRKEESFNFEHLQAAVKFLKKNYYDAAIATSTANAGFRQGREIQSSSPRHRFSKVAVD